MSKKLNYFLSENEAKDIFIKRLEKWLEQYTG